MCDHCLHQTYRPSGSLWMLGCCCCQRMFGLFSQEALDAGREPPKAPHDPGGALGVISKPDYGVKG